MLRSFAAPLPEVTIKPQSHCTAARFSTRYLLTVPTSVSNGRQPNVMNSRDSLQKHWSGSHWPPRTRSYAHWRACFARARNCCGTCSWTGLHEPDAKPYRRPRASTGSSRSSGVGEPHQRPEIGCHWHDGIGLATRGLSRVPQVDPVGAPVFQQAQIAALKGDTAKAMHLIKSLPHGVHPHDFIQFHIDPAFRNLYPMPRFQRLLVAQGLARSVRRP